MLCSNCKNEIADDSEQCPFCHVFVKNLKLKTNAEPKEVCVLQLETGEEFELSIEHCVDGKITIGRVDLGVKPMIDLGPYDSGPFVSRLQGVFEWSSGDIYYTDTGKNTVSVNGKKLDNNNKIKLKNHDELKFGEISAQIIFK